MTSSITDGDGPSRLSPADLDALPEATVLMVVTGSDTHAFVATEGHFDTAAEHPREWRMSGVHGSVLSEHVLGLGDPVILSVPRTRQAA